MRKIWAGFALFFAVHLFTAFPVLAGDNATERSPKGFVKSVSGTEIVVTQYDEGKNAEVDVVYQITPETQAEIYGDIPVSQVKVGDEVEIDYHNNNKKMVAEYVSVDLSSYE